MSFGASSHGPPAPQQRRSRGWWAWVLAGLAVVGAGALIGGRGTPLAPLFEGGIRGSELEGGTAAGPTSAPLVEGGTEGEGIAGRPGGGVTHAELFFLRSEGDARVLEVWPAGRTERSLEYLLVRRGQAPTTPPEGFAAVVEVPVRRLATTSTTEIPFLEILGSLEVLVAHSGLRYVSNPAVRERHRRGEIVELGPSGALDLERLVASRAEVVLASPGGDPWLETLRQLDRAETLLVELPSFREASALGRAEWIVAVGALLDREDEARRWFADLEARYGEWTQRARGLGPGPSVVTGAPSGGIWYAPSGESFLAGLLRDSGARSVWDGLEGRRGSVPLDLEAALARGAAAEVWLQPGSFASVDEIRRAFPRLASIPALVAGRVWTNDARLEDEWANDYWETGVVRPDLVLADFLAILHPDEVDHELIFHRRLPSGEDRGRAPEPRGSAPPPKGS